MPRAQPAAVFTLCQRSISATLWRSSGVCGARRSHRGPCRATSRRPVASPAGSAVGPRLKVTAADIEDFIVFLLDGYTASTAAVRFKSLQQALRLARRRRLGQASSRRPGCKSESPTAPCRPTHSTGRPAWRDGGADSTSRMKGAAPSWDGGMRTMASPGLSAGQDVRGQRRPRNRYRAGRGCQHVSRPRPRCPSRPTGRRGATG